jgi:hypothetical protein
LPAKTLDMKKTHPFKLLYLFSVLLVVSYSCKKETKSLTEKELLSAEREIDPAKINKAQLNSEAVEYYENIAKMAEFYATHPDIVNAIYSKNRITVSSDSTDTVNPILEKLLSIDMVDSVDNKLSFFVLEPEERKEFLDAFVTTEANALTEKLEMDTTVSREMTASLSQQNDIVNRVLSSKKNSYNISNNKDPYPLIYEAMLREERNSQLSKEKIETLSKQPDTYSSILKKAGKARVSNDSEFWANAALNGILSAGPIQYMPVSLTPRKFVQRIVNNSERGRLLISLPGGWTTTWPVIWYSNGTADVGHVGVIFRTKGEIINDLNVAGRITDDEANKYDLTIGATNGPGVHREDIWGNWGKTHGISFVGQIFDVTWKWRWRGFRSGLYRYENDVNNESIAQGFEDQLGKSYCHWTGVLFAKWAAPNKFICSSLAWYVAKHKGNTNISDWWKTTIFPAGVYRSDRVRIVDNTLF